MTDKEKIKEEVRKIATEKLKTEGSGNITNYTIDLAISKTAKAIFDDFPNICQQCAEKVKDYEKKWV